MAISISWALLTFNRASTVVKAITQNMETSNHQWDEMIWVDNGSFANERNAIDEVVSKSPNVTKVFNPTNLGVDIGYNRAIALSKSDWILITGCDRLMFDGWLGKMVKVITENPKLKVLSIYSLPIEKCAERKRGIVTERSGFKVCPALPFGARIFHRDLLKKAGYFREDFGLYGWSDLEFAERQVKVCRENDWEFLAFAEDHATHLGDEGNGEYKGLDPKEYYQFKQQQVNDPKKLKLLDWCKDNGYPYYNPWGRE